MDYGCVIFERGNVKMGNKGKDKRKNEERNYARENKTFFKEMRKFFAHPIVTTLIAAAVPGAIMWTAGLLSLPNKVENLDKRLMNVEKSILELNVEGDIELMNKDISSLADRISRMEDFVMDNAKLVPTAKAIDSMKIEYESVQSVYCLSTPTWKSVDIIAKDSRNGKEFTAQDLAGEKILLPYTHEEQEIFFYGQYDENNQWDGDCLINVYENEKLVLIMESQYDSGELMSYKQVLPAKNKSGDIWVFSKRMCNGEWNSGESWNYKREDEWQKAFSVDSAKTSDIVDTETFMSYMSSCLGYYNGNTSNGLYNDDTGKAYFVEYAKDGTVKTLYQGKFSNGQFNDDTREAWYITKREDTDYMYFKGIFKNGDAMKDRESDFENPVSVERIKEITKGKLFNCKVEWFGENKA